MKKIILFTAVVSAFSFASCKKDHTCSCTDTSTQTTVTTWQAGNSQTTTSTNSTANVYVITGAKKKDAKKACIDENRTSTYSYNSGGSNPATGNFETNSNAITDKTVTACSVK